MQSRRKDSRSCFFQVRYLNFWLHVLSDWEIVWTLFSSAYFSTTNDTGGRLTLLYDSLVIRKEGYLAGSGLGVTGHRMCGMSEEQGIWYLGYLVRRNIPRVGQTLLTALRERSLTRIPHVSGSQTTQSPTVLSLTKKDVPNLVTWLQVWNLATQLNWSEVSRQKVPSISGPHLDALYVGCLKHKTPHHHTRHVFYIPVVSPTEATIPRGIWWNAAQMVFIISSLCTHITHWSCTSESTMIQITNQVTTTQMANSLSVQGHCLRHWRCSSFSWDWPFWCCWRNWRNRIRRWVKTDPKVEHETSIHFAICNTQVNLWHLFHTTFCAKILAVGVCSCSLACSLLALKVLSKSMKSSAVVQRNNGHI